MTTEVQEENANPYNMNKSWHKEDEIGFQNADGVFFEKPKAKQEADIEEPVEQVAKEETPKDEPYKRPDYKKRYDDLKKHYDSKLNEFKSRTKLDLTEPDIQIDNNLALGGLTYTYDWFDITYLVSAYKQNIDSQSIIAMETFANFYGNYLKDRFDDITPEDYEMLNYENNLAFNFFLGDLEISFEKSWVYYNKIMDERIFGSRFYFSSYLNFYDYYCIHNY